MKGLTDNFFKMMLLIIFVLVLFVILTQLQDDKLENFQNDAGGAGAECSTEIPPNATGCYPKENKRCRYETLCPTYSVEGDPNKCPYKCKSNEDSNLECDNKDYSECINTSGCVWNEEEGVSSCIPNDNVCIPKDNGKNSSISYPSISNIDGYYNLNERFCLSKDDPTNCIGKCIWNDGYCQVRDNYHQYYEKKCNKHECERNSYNCDVNDDVCVVKEEKKNHYEKKCSPIFDKEDCLNKKSVILGYDQCVYFENGNKFENVCRPEDQIYFDCYNKKVIQIEDKEGCESEEKKKQVRI